MTTLTVSNGYQASLPGVGKIRGLRNLTEKRVTKAVREELRRWYGFDDIEVTCEAALTAHGWEGRCKIHGEPLRFKLS